MTSDTTAENRRVPIRLRVNGSTESAAVPPRLLLSDFLREGLGLTGTHVGCEHGVCGACTVLIDGTAARSCLTLAVQADEADITTIEGLAEPDGTLSTVQQAFADHFSLQCGFCTAGFLMSIAGELEQGMTEPEIRELLSGNLCRCTGYQSIVEAAVELAGTREA